MWHVARAGDRALLITLGKAIDPALLAQVLAFDQALQERRPEGLLDAIPAYASVLCRYDPAITTAERLEKGIRQLEGRLRSSPSFGPIVEIPTTYDGPDLGDVAAKTDLSTTAVIEFINPGRWTTIQDRGRPGRERFGIPPGGAADWFAAAVANRLAGNHPDAALLECTAAGPSLRFDSDGVVAVTGALAAGTETW